MSDLATPVRHSAIFMLFGHGDLKIEWEESNHDAVAAMIQAKMDAGVSFYILDPRSKAKKPPLVQIENISQATGRNVYIRDPDIAKLVEAGLANIASFAGVGEMKTAGKAKTADEAAKTDTIAVRPAQGG